MSEKKIAEVKEMGMMLRGGKKVPCYRVVSPVTGKPLQTKDEKYIDGGGQHLKNLAQIKADEINEHYSK